MSANYSHATRSPLRPVYRLRIKCPVCGKPDNCAVSEDRTRAFCRRVASPHQGRDGGWLHILEDRRHLTTSQRATIAGKIANLKDGQTKSAAPNGAAEPVSVADEARRHSVYTALLHELQLSPADYASLRARGLNDEAIEGGQFKSTPTKDEAAAITRVLANTHDLARVPGFYQANSTPRLVWMDTGIIIPARGHQARIRALMYRRTHARKDENFGKYIWLSSAEDRDGRPREAGASSGAPCHFANAHMMKDAEAVTLTEGALKAEIAASLLNQPVIGNAPSCFGADFAANLKKDFPQLKTVFVAFDMDFKRNDCVKGALFRLVEQLEKARFCVRVRTWPDRWKGIDDYLLGVSQQEVAA
jgi:hypothetical protein